MVVYAIVLILVYSLADREDIFSAWGWYRYPTMRAATIFNDVINSLLYSELTLVRLDSWISGCQSQSVLVVDNTRRSYGEEWTKRSYYPPSKTTP